MVQSKFRLKYRSKTTFTDEDGQIVERWPNTGTICSLWSSRCTPDSYNSQNTIYKILLNAFFPEKIVKIHFCTCISSNGAAVCHLL